MHSICLLRKKKISFYNNYFVFVKISDSDPVVEVEGELVSAADKKETIDEEEPGLEEKTDTKTTTNTTTTV